MVQRFLIYRRDRELGKWTRWVHIVSIHSTEEEMNSSIAAANFRDPDREFKWVKLPESKT